MTTKNDAMWKRNDIQFPRLLAEIFAIGLEPWQIKDLKESMDLTADQISELFQRAEKEWEKIKETHCK